MLAFSDFLDTIRDLGGLVFLDIRDMYGITPVPQQFKQLLMVSGIDKYFQIAPCFRDEDARADGSPGEFYQFRTELGKRLDLIKDDTFEFCGIVDFPMYELKE